MVNHCRRLNFTTYDEAIDEIERLAHDGYRKTGQWNLGQICRHLAWYAKGSLDGFDKMLPWVVRATVGKWARKKLMSGAPMPVGMPTAPQSVAPPDEAEAAAVAEYLGLLRRLRDQGDAPLSPSPLLGEMTADEWKRLHLAHTAHHLSFLVPGPER